MIISRKLVDEVAEFSHIFHQQFSFRDAGKVYADSVSDYNLVVDVGWWIGCQFSQKFLQKFGAVLFIGISGYGSVVDHIDEGAGAFLLRRLREFFLHALKHHIYE